MLKSDSGISGETKIKKHNPCHQEVHSSLRGIKQIFTEKELSLMAGSAMRQWMERQQWGVSKPWGAGSCSAAFIIKFLWCRWLDREGEHWQWLPLDQTLVGLLWTILSTRPSYLSFCDNLCRTYFFKQSISRIFSR